MLSPKEADSKELYEPPASGNTLAQLGHYPFGESWYNTASDKFLFTTYERDAESGNDYAMARSYVNRLARFSSPDPVTGVTELPQSLNTYPYSLNDPCNLTDPLGLKPCTLNVQSNSYLPTTIQTVVQNIFNNAGINITFNDGAAANIQVQTYVSLPGALGNDPDLGSTVQLNNAAINQIASALSPGNLQQLSTMAQTATGVILSHEIGHYLLQQGHPAVGNVGIMRPGNEQGTTAFSLDLSGRQNFTKPQALAIRLRCKALQTVSPSGRGGGGPGGGLRLVAADDSADAGWFWLVVQTWVTSRIVPGTTRPE